MRSFLSSHKHLPLKFDIARRHCDASWVTGAKFLVATAHGCATASSGAGRRDHKRRCNGNLRRDGKLWASAGQRQAEGGTMVFQNSTREL